MQLAGRERKIWNNVNPTLRVMSPLHQESMCHCGEASSNRQSIGKLQWRGFSFCNETQVPTGIKSLQPVIAINTELLWGLQAFNIKAQADWPSRAALPHFIPVKTIRHTSKLMSSEKAAWLYPQKRNNRSVKTCISPISEELASEILQSLRQHELAGFAGMNLLSH